MISYCGQGFVGHDIKPVVPALKFYQLSLGSNFAAFCNIVLCLMDFLMDVILSICVCSI